MASAVPRMSLNRSARYSRSRACCSASSTSSALSSRTPNPEPESRTAPSLHHVIPDVADGLDDGRDGEHGGIEGDGGAIGGVVDARGATPGELLQGALDVGGAGGAGHAGDRQRDRISSFGSSAIPSLETRHRAEVGQRRAVGDAGIVRSDDGCSAGQALLLASVIRTIRERSVNRAKIGGVASASSTSPGATACIPSGAERRQLQAWQWKRLLHRQPTVESFESGACLRPER